MADRSLPRYPSEPDGTEVPGQVGDGIAITPHRAGFGHQFGYRAIVTVNQRSSQIAWERRSMLWLSPGQHHVRVEAESTLGRTTGSADFVVLVGGGRPVELEYQFFASKGFGTGALGPRSLDPGPDAAGLIQQRYNANMRLFLIIGVIFVVTVAVMGLTELLD